MAKKTTKKQPRKSKKQAHPLHPGLDAPGTNREQAKAIHGKGMPNALYASSLMNLMKGRFDEDAKLYAQTVHEEMNPRDPVEAMLISQMLFAHARVQHLTNLLGAQTSVEGIRVIAEYTEKASNTYRRHMLALAEYRRPPKSGDTFAVVKQANIAQQQVVQNQGGNRENATNEQGSSHCTSPAPNHDQAKPALPADTGRDGLASILSKENEAVEEINGAEDCRGETAE